LHRSEGDARGFEVLSDDAKECLVRVEEGKLVLRFFISDTKTNDDHQSRLRLLERWGWAAWGAGWLIQFALID
jgi:hypothetical protein